MEIVYKKVNDIKEYEENARKNSSGVSKVAESIREFGFLQPIVLDKNNVILAGHTRLKAALKLGMEEVPCITHNLSEDDARLARIIDNKSHEYATWDVEKLHKELNTINLDVKTTFFTPGKDRTYYKDNKCIIFGKTLIPITEDEYNRLKVIYERYLKEHSTYFGFINYLIGDDS